MNNKWQQTANPTFIVNMNFNRIELGSWIEKRKRPDGDYDLIGMGRRTEYDADTGAMVSDKIEPTGITGVAPAETLIYLDGL